jgi:hypothetical protein
MRAARGLRTGERVPVWESDAVEARLQSGAGVLRCAKFLFKYTNLWYASRQGHGGYFPAITLITNSILFSALPNCAEANFFWNFALFLSQETDSGCYIEFSGFSSSRVSCIQESILNTTYVIADTTAHPERTIKQG